MTISNTHDNNTTEEPGGDRWEETDEARLDAVFGALSNARRRRVIRILRATGRETVSVSFLAEALTEREPGDPTTRQLAVSLTNVHLPKLAATGIVDYAADRSRVQYADPPLVEHLLDRV